MNTLKIQWLWAIPPKSRRKGIYHAKAEPVGYDPKWDSNQN